MNRFICVLCLMLTVMSPIDSSSPTDLAISSSADVMELSSEEIAQLKATAGKLSYLASAIMHLALPKIVSDGHDIDSSQRAVDCADEVCKVSAVTEIAIYAIVDNVFSYSVYQALEGQKEKMGIKLNVSPNSMHALKKTFRDEVKHLLNAVDLGIQARQLDINFVLSVMLMHAAYKELDSSLPSIVRVLRLLPSCIQRTQPVMDTVDIEVNQTMQLLVNQAATKASAFIKAEDVYQMQAHKKRLKLMITRHSQEMEQLRHNQETGQLSDKIQQLSDKIQQLSDNTQKYSQMQKQARLRQLNQAQEQLSQTQEKLSQMQRQVMPESTLAEPIPVILSAEASGSASVIIEDNAQLCIISDAIKAHEICNWVFRVITAIRQMQVQSRHQSQLRRQRYLQIEAAVPIPAAETSTQTNIFIDSKIQQEIMKAAIKAALEDIQKDIKPKCDVDDDIDDVVVVSVAAVIANTATSQDDKKALFDRAYYELRSMSCAKKTEIEKKAECAKKQEKERQKKEEERIHAYYARMNLSVPIEQPASSSSDAALPLTQETLAHLSQDGSNEVLTRRLLRDICQQDKLRSIWEKGRRL